MASPFLKFSDAFSFTDQGTFSQGVRLDFDQDYFSVEFKWDRMIFVSQFNLDRLGKKDDTTNTMFDIFNLIKEKETFGQVNNYVCQIIIVELGEQEFTKEVRDFEAKYLKDEAGELVKEPTDINLTLEKDKGDKKLNVTKGPYQPNDIERHGLIPFKMADDPFTPMRSQNGVMTEYRIFENIKDVSQSTLANAVKEIKKEAEIK